MSLFRSPVKSPREGAPLPYVNQAANVAVVPSGFRTTTSTGPGACAAAIAKTVSVFSTTTPVAGVPPMETVAPCRKATRP